MEEKEVKPETKNSSIVKGNNKIIVIILGVIIVLLVGIVVYLLLTRNNGENTLKPTDSIERKEKDKSDIQKELEKVNEKVFELLSSSKTLDEFKKQAMNYFTDDVINELIKYYDKNTESICLDTASCGVGGGFLLETTDIFYRKLEIVDIKDDIIVVNGIYGEAEDNISGKTEITYKKVNGVWKISEYNLKNNNEEKPSDNKEEQVNVPDKAIAYKNNNGKIIYLLEVANEKQNTGLNPHTYELYENGNKIKVYSYYEDSKFIVSNDNNWYYLDKTNKKIISFYSSKNMIDYKRNGKSEDKQEWYIIFDNNNEKIVQIVNETKGTVLSFNSNNPDDYIIENEKIYLKFNNKIIKYDATGKTIDTKTYNKVIYFGRYGGGVNNLIVIQNNNYYKVDLSNMKEELLSKEITYSDSTQNLDLYLLNKGTDEYNRSMYIFAYKGKYYTTDLSEYGENDSEYSNIYFDRIEGEAQNSVGSFLINKNNKKVVEYCDFCSYGIHKVSNGYFFDKSEFREEDNPYDISTTDRVITSNGKTLTGKGMYAQIDNNFILQNNNEIIAYDVNGNIIKKINTDVLYLIMDNYSFAKINGKYYVINLRTFEQKEIQITNGFDVNNSLIYSIDNEKLFFVKMKNDMVIDGKEYTYNYITGVIKVSD